jgi:predicted methyltransferase
MARILGRRGRVVFYTGTPYTKGRGRDLVGGVGKRLSLAGLRPRWREELQCFVAVKA